MPDASQYGQIRFRDQVIMITPPHLRSVTMIDFGSSLVKPLDEIMDIDWDYIYDQYVKGHLTGQKMVMQEGLNFLFDIPVGSRSNIRVETIRGEGGTTYVHNEIELLETFVYNEAEGTTTYVYNEAEDQSGIYDFIVKIPTVRATAENLDKLARQVDLIKLTGTTYEIITY